MKNPWSQPSLSRDFALLAAAILFVLFLISAWVSYATYLRHVDHVSDELKYEANRIDQVLSQHMRDTDYMLSSLGRQLIQEKNRDKVTLARILKSFDNRGYIFSVFSYIDDKQRVVVSSNRGVLSKSVDVSDRDYVKLATQEPWAMRIGTPIEGRVSRRWVIPAAMGITDYTGKFIGSLVISLDIDILTQKIDTIVKRDGINFALITKDLIPFTDSSEQENFITKTFPKERLLEIGASKNKSGLLSQGNLFLGSSIYSFYHTSTQYPYVILLNYDAHYNNQNVRRQLWSRLLQVLGFAVFFVLFLWIMRARIIRPVLELTEIARNIARGQHYTSKPQGRPVEIESLSAQMGVISEYIAETKRIEDELRNKMFLLKKDKEWGNVEKRSRSEFLEYICQELRNPVNKVLGYAQAMKEQLYGPIENRKYQQCANDIYQSSNNMLSNLNNLLEFNKAYDEYMLLPEETVDLLATIKRASTAIAANDLISEIDAEEDLPKLFLPEFRLLQIIANILIYISKIKKPDQLAKISIKKIDRKREASALAIIITTGDETLHPVSNIEILANQLYENTLPYIPLPENDPNNELELELAKTMIVMCHGILDVIITEDSVSIAVIFGGARIRKTSEYTG